MSNDLCNIPFILILMKFCSFKRPMKFFIHFVIWHKHEEKVDEINCSWQLHWSCYLSVNVIKVSNCYFVSTQSKYIVHLLLVIIWLKVSAALSFFCCGFFFSDEGFYRYRRFDDEWFGTESILSSQANDSIFVDSV